ncbi:MAG: hypothetical protein JWM49_2691 [Microbacteriaceae bacterium]|nr:hypothetical protein [Microbacteriaceae bacterium]
MAEDGEPRIDPRYHPAFQRGYTPEPGAERAREREFTPSVVALESSIESPDVESAQEIGSVQVIADLELELARRTRARRVNPYYVGLWIAGILSILASGALSSLPLFLNSAIEQDSASRSLQLLAYLLPGPLATVGLAIIVGLVFVKANALRKTRA